MNFINNQTMKTTHCSCHQATQLHKVKQERAKQKQLRKEKPTTKQIHKKAFI
jgi:hypothetical protein